MLVGAPGLGCFPPLGPETTVVWEVAFFVGPLLGAQIWCSGQFVNNLYDTR